MKEITRILIKAKKNLLEYQELNAPIGLCVANDYLTCRQKTIYKSYLNKHLFPTHPAKFRYYGGRYSFQPHDYKSRLKWLNKHIKLTSK